QAAGLDEAGRGHPRFGDDDAGPERESFADAVRFVPDQADHAEPGAADTDRIADPQLEALGEGGRDGYVEGGGARCQGAGSERELPEERPAIIDALHIGEDRAVAIEPGHHRPHADRARDGADLFEGAALRRQRIALCDAHLDIAAQYLL